ncbi:immunoglobulin-like domain-containing protein, partial [Methanocalculus natronophilus]|uniref:immunoglobulin-like domain-containing protein n=1 Tax=Methanocalculus natronophilus TaxID=1262400 RepID=UPI0031B5E7DD
SIEDQEILSSDNDYHVEPTETTLADFHEQDLEQIDLHGHHFTVTGRIETRGQYDNMAIVDLNDPDLYFMVYHQSWASDIEVLEDNEGDIVEITVIYYTDHSRDGVLVVFQGDESDLGEVELGDEELFNADVSQVDGSSYLTFEDDIELPTTGDNDTEFSGWTSSHDDLIADDGSFVSRPTDDTEVTLTGTATLGTLSEDVEVTVTVIGTEAMSISDAYDLNDGEKAHVEGIVTAWNVYDDGLFIQSEDGLGLYVRLFSRDMDAFEDVEPGDKISVYGTLGRY